MAKRRKTHSILGDLDLDFNIDEKLNDKTVKQLKDYIRKGVDYLNESKDEFGSLTRTAKKVLDDLRDISHSTGETLNYGFKGKRKDELLVYAERLRTMLKLGTGFTLEHGRQREFKRFKRTTGVSLKYNDYVRLMDVFGALGENILQKFGSTEVAQIFSENKNLGTTDLVRLMRNVLKENKGNGLSKSELLERLTSKVKAKVNRK